jgi:transposase
MKQQAKVDLSNSGPREKRYFTESAQREVVAEIDKGLGKSEAARRYQVSEATIYNWVRKHSKTYQKSVVMVVESASARSRVHELEAQLEAAYALLGRASAENLVLSAVIAEASEDLHIDLKKNIETKRLSVFGAKNLKKA